MLLLDTHNIVRLPQHVHHGLGESEDRHFVHLDDNHLNQDSAAFRSVVPLAR